MTVASIMGGGNQAEPGRKPRPSSQLEMLGVVLFCNHAKQCNFEFAAEIIRNYEYKNFMKHYHQKERPYLIDKTYNSISICHIIKTCDPQATRSQVISLG